MNIEQLSVLKKNLFHLTKKISPTKEVYTGISYIYNYKKFWEGLKYNKFSTDKGEVNGIEYIAQKKILNAMKSIGTILVILKN